MERIQSTVKTSEEEKSFLKECEEHVYFFRNMDNHAFTNILITKLIGMVRDNQREE